MFKMENTNLQTLINLNTFILSLFILSGKWTYLLSANSRFTDSHGVIRETDTKMDRCARDLFRKIPMKDVSEGSRNRIGEPSNNCKSDTFHFYLQYTVKQWKARSKGMAAGGCHYLCSLKLFVFKGDLSSTPGPLWSVLYASQIHFFCMFGEQILHGSHMLPFWRENLKRGSQQSELHLPSQQMP